MKRQDINIGLDSYYVSFASDLSISPNIVTQMIINPLTIKKVSCISKPVKVLFVCDYVMYIAGMGLIQS